MKKYLADVLTAMRFVCVVVILAASGVQIVSSVAEKLPEWVMYNSGVEFVFWMFLFGELTDALDGICARRWPFPKGKEPRYRKYAEKYDMISDVLLGIAVLVFYMFRVHFSLGVVLLVIAAVVGMTVEIVAYGRLFGLPETCKPWSLMARHPEAAKTLILIRRRLYLAEIGVVAVRLLMATQYHFWLKAGIIGLAVVVAVVLIAVKQNRLHEVKTRR